MGARSDPLAEAIAGAWAVFDLPAPATTGVCRGCCMDPSIEADFLLRRARDLPQAYIRDWYDAAAGTGIRHAEVAWFLPRVMEMLAAGDVVAGVGHQVVFARLPLAGFPDLWPAAEVAVVNRFAQALFAAKLAGPEPLGDLDSWLCLFGWGGIEMAPLLAQLDGLEDRALIALLHRDWVRDGRSEIPVDAFWNKGTARRAVWDWYTGPAMLTRLERAMLAGSEEAVVLWDVIVDALPH